MSEHTKLPWEVIKLRREKDGPVTLCSVEAADKEFIADSQLDACDDEETRQRAIANMEFIVKACNNHDSLVGVAKHMLAVLEKIDFAELDIEYDNCHWADWEIAIKKAE
jgi:hypothetical protein